MRSYQHLLIETRDGLTRVTLDRPQQGNAVHDALHSELATVFRDLQRDADTRAVVLTGAGDSFCVGGDKNPDREYQATPGTTPIQEAAEIVLGVLDLTKPIVAAVNGDALGLGATLATLADVAIAATGARFGDAHVTGGLPAGNGPAALWPSLIGPSRAKYLLLGGEIVPVEQAADWGLLHDVVPRDDVIPHASDLARRWAALSPFAVRSTKAVINGQLRGRVQDALALSLALEEHAMERPEFRDRLRVSGADTVQDEVDERSPELG